MKNKAPLTYVNPPEKCDMPGCNVRFDNTGDCFVDGRTTIGPWANMCVPHHRRIGVGLGTGRGQKWQRQADGSFIKIEG